MIPLLVPHQPPQWVLLDLQGDVTLPSTTALHPTPLHSFPIDKSTTSNCVEQWGGLELGTVHLHHGRPQLRIGNALLHCQLKPLPKPMLVLTRGRHRERGEGETTVEGEEEGEGKVKDLRLHCVAVVRMKVSVITRPVPIIVSTPGPMPTLS